MGSTGTGKTYFAYQQAYELVKNGEHVLFLSSFDDTEKSNIEKKIITLQEDIKNILPSLLKRESMHVIFQTGEIGREKSKELENDFLHEIFKNIDSLKGMYLFIDEAQNIDKVNLAVLCSEVRKYDIGLVLIHQYFDQFSEKIKSDIKNYFKNGIYFKTFENDINNILDLFPHSGKTKGDFENLETGQYIVFEK